ncbi:hypothetical protein [Paenibacillus sp. SYP-B3998]|uniref:hypothetical protein n=1 Tax=Paenibacillus sp. SYP-B3998 TaxID=2678564 RepID=UPI0013D8D236|nr:hypothetical protein [Paenibacillus sp. SYP-B3998]
MNTPIRPMGIGRILDRSFLLYRKHFVKLTLVMLILYGPFYLLQHLLLYQEAASASASILDQIRNGGSWQDIVTSGAAFRGTSPDIDVWKSLVFLLVLFPLFLLGMMPASVASVVHLVKAHLLGEKVPGVGDMLKKSFRRFWPLAGSTALDGLIVLGMYVVFFFIFGIFVIVFALGAGLSGTLSGSGMGTGVVIGIIFFILLTIAGLLTGAYFFLRWGYYLPIVALGEDSIGLSRSWRLTRGNFWRLFLMFFVLIIILYLFQAVIQLIVTAAFGLGLGAQLLLSLVSILIAPLGILSYAISFFDLKVRNDGLGLETMIHNTINPSGSEQLYQPERIEPALPRVVESELPNQLEEQSLPREESQGREQQEAFLEPDPFDPFDEQENQQALNKAEDREPQNQNEASQKDGKPEDSDKKNE